MPVFLLGAGFNRDAKQEAGKIMVLWYFPEYKIAVISTSYADMSVSQNVEKSVTPCARPLRFPWTSPM